MTSMQIGAEPVYRGDPARRTQTRSTRVQYGGGVTVTVPERVTVPPYGPVARPE
jgi:hypothetical protein